MDVYHFVIFLERSRRNDFGQGRRDEEGGLLPFSPFILFPFYSFTLLLFYSFTFLLFYLFTLLPFLEFPSCREADVATRLVLTGYLFYLF